ncbi:MAG: tyrosine-type recombinase/integrase [Thermoanaerobaculia bacterium]
MGKPAKPPQPREGTSNVVQWPKGTGPFYIQPFITHPPFCICDWCKKKRQTADEWSQPFRQWINRKSKFPYDKMRSVAYSDEVVREEERLLVEAVERSRRNREALGAAVSFTTLCKAYREHQIEKGKRYDKDQYRIDLLEEKFGERDAVSINLDDADDLAEELRRDRGVGPQTINRYLTTLVAILNFGKTKRKIATHALDGLKKEEVRRPGRPRTFSRSQIEILFGAAMDAYELEQAEKGLRLGGKAGKNTVMRGSVVPLRGICLIAYRTLMRPNNNLGLLWEELHIDEVARKRHFELKKHKNSSKGIEARGPLSPSLMEYLLSIRPEGKPTGLVHPSPETGKPYVNIRHQWKRLIEIANGLLAENEQITDEIDFYNLRHTGASELVAKGADPVMIVRMMGDTSLATVMKHYFDSSLEHMQEVVERWDSVPASAITVQ